MYYRVYADTIEEIYLAVYPTLFYSIIGKLRLEDHLSFKIEKMQLWLGKNDNLFIGVHEIVYEVIDTDIKELCAAECAYDTE